MNRNGKYERLVNQLIAGQTDTGRTQLRAIPTCGQVRRCRPVRFV